MFFVLAFRSRLVLVFDAVYLIPSYLQAQESGEQFQWYIPGKRPVNCNRKNPKLLLDIYTNWADGVKNGPVPIGIRQCSISTNISTRLKWMQRRKIRCIFRGKHMASNRIPIERTCAVPLNGQMSYPTTVFLDEMNPIGPGRLHGQPADADRDALFQEDLYKTKRWEDYLG